MLPTFVIGLREGLEASLIVGIIAAFLKKSGAGSSLRPLFFGVGLASFLCTGFAIVLDVLERNLPQRQQEGLETVVGMVAVGMVTYMIVWMKRNASGLRGDLEIRAANALSSGSTRILVAMAFFAVLREGVEASVFMLAAFQLSTNPSTTGTGAVLGVVTAIILGIAIYRGGIRLNLSRFFRITGVVLVLVAAGLLSTAVHTAHEAGWVNTAQQQAFNLTAVLKQGSFVSAITTASIGIQSRPTVGEAILWFSYAIPLSVYVLMPIRRKSKTIAKPQMAHS